MIVHTTRRQKKERTENYEVFVRDLPKQPPAKKNMRCLSVTSGALGRHDGSTIDITERPPGVWRQLNQTQDLVKRDGVQCSESSQIPLRCSCSREAVGLRKK